MSTSTTIFIPYYTAAHRAPGVLPDWSKPAAASMDLAGAHRTIAEGREVELLTGLARV